MPVMKVKVDFDLCESNAVCMGILPEVFEVRDDDFLYILDETPPEELRERCLEAARICPKQAIEIVDEETDDIPEWQKEAVRKTLLDVQQHPEQLQPWEIVKQKYKRP